MTHRTAASPKEAVEEGTDADHGMPASRKLQGERGGGAALKENVCQVEHVAHLPFHCMLVYEEKPSPSLNGRSRLE